MRGRLGCLAGGPQIYVIYDYITQNHENVAAVQKSDNLIENSRKHECGDQETLGRCSQRRPNMGLRH